MATKLRQEQLSDQITNYGLFRQAIINGNFDVWQRGTSFTSSDTVAPFFTADRFYGDAIYPGSGKTFTVSQLAITDLPGSNFALQTSWVAAPVDQGRMCVYQTLENINAKKLAGKIVTFSCYIKSKAGMTSVNIDSLYNTTGSKISFGDTGITGTSTNINTSTWTKVTQTFTVTSLGTLGANGTIGIQIKAIKSTGESTADGIQIAQVQLCAGDVAIPFMPKSYAEELRDCQRYLELVGCGCFGQWNTTTSARIYGSYKATKRAVTTLSLISSTPAIEEVNVADRTGSGSAISSSDIKTNGFMVVVNGFTSATSGNRAASRSDLCYAESEL